ncbi:MAG: hypothetical protein VKJ06_04910 [Vampirovibrionales bacterium]|nr:hypothetical protein [Vampirovibrionales bacterium]
MQLLNLFCLKMSTNYINWLDTLSQNTKSSSPVKQMQGAHKLLERLSSPTILPQVIDLFARPENIGRIRENPNGFVTFPLASSTDNRLDLTLHVFDPVNGPNTYPEYRKEAMHYHFFHLTSKTLLGKIKHFFWKPCHKNDPAAVARERYNFSRELVGTPYTITHKGRSYLKQAKSKEVPAGQGFYMPNRVIHNADYPLNQPTVTLVLRTNLNPISADAFLTSRQVVQNIQAGGQSAKISNHDAKDLIKSTLAQLDS